MSGWDEKAVPDQSGRVAVVTGANSGLGYVAARELARKGARVVLACRSEVRGSAAADRIVGEVPGAVAEFARLDLGDLGSVREFADRVPYERLDLLVNNAGVMALPYGTTADGFETQFGVNHLGHFALTGLLLPVLLGTPGARVVTLSSLSHAHGQHRHRRPQQRAPLPALDRLRPLQDRQPALHARAGAQARGTGADVVAAAAHPGYAATNLQTAPRMEGRRARRAVHGDRQPGPRPVGRGRRTAHPVRGDRPRRAARLLHRTVVHDVARRAGALVAGTWTLDDRAGELLWAASEQLTGVTYAGLKV